MKNKIVLALILAASPSLWAAENQSVTTSATPEVSNPRPITLSLEPLWLIVSGIGARADFAVSDRVSLGLQGTYIPLHNSETTSDSSNVYGKFKWSAEEINIGPTFMLTGQTGTSGAYISPAIGYQKTQIKDYGVNNLGGSLESPQARLTAGYQWILPRAHLRFVAGGGLRVLKSSNVVVKDSSGNEVYSEKSSALGGLAIDGAIGFTF